MYLTIENVVKPKNKCGGKCYQIAIGICALVIENQNQIKWDLVINELR